MFVSLRCCIWQFPDHHPPCRESYLERKPELRLPTLWNQSKLPHGSSIDPHKGPQLRSYRSPRHWFFDLTLAFYEFLLMLDRVGSPGPTFRATMFQFSAPPPVPLATSGKSWKGRGRARSFRHPRGNSRATIVEMESRKILS